MSINDETLRLAQAMRVSVDHQVDLAVRQSVKAWARAWDEIRATWADAAMDLALASTDGKWPTPWQVMAEQRAIEALAVATDQIHQLGTETGVTVRDFAGKVIDATPGWQEEIVASQLPEATSNRYDAPIRFNRMDPATLVGITDRTAQNITAATYRLEIAGQEAMRRALIRGVTVGDNPRKAARAMVKRAEGAFNGGLTRALTIARTEILDAHRYTAFGYQVLNEHLIAGWVWQAQLDTRTCPSCWALHGTEHDLTEQGPHDHQQGRCARLPLTRSWQDLGFDIPEAPSVLPDAQAEFDALSKADRLAIMGPARLQAIDDGAATLADMAQRRFTPGWRDSWVPVPARDLRRAS